MTTFALTAATFEEQVTRPGITFVDFWAPWCGPCLQFASIYERSALVHPDIAFAKVNTEEERVLAASASISSIPTLMAFRDGILVFREAGVLPAAALEDTIAAVRAIDMDDVRSRLAKRKAPA